MRLSTPILLLVFNRPAQSLEVMEKIRQQKPKQLFIAADGPRDNRPGETALCAETREAVLKKIDWPCDLHTRFLDENMGCGKAVSSAVNWFFNQVEAGIILEDDCVPDATFFSFCETMLQRYRHDERIMHIAGSNYQMGIQRGMGSYYISRFAHIWGWATWRRAWQYYDFTLKTYMQHSREGLPAHYHGDMEAILEHKIDTWDIQWFLSVWFNGGWSIAPNTNLIKNIGYGRGATHTHTVPPWFKRMSYGAINYIVHPEVLKPDQAADDYVTNTLYKPGSIKYQMKKMIKRNNLFQQLYKRIS